MVSLKNLLFLSTGALAAAVTATAPASAQQSTSTSPSASSIPPTLNSGTAGAAILPIGTLGGNGSYSVVPAGFDGGRHNAPAAQWVIFLSGLAHITLPHPHRSNTANNEAWILGGKNGAILALDTADVSADGHITRYPSGEATIALQIPLEGGVPPKHRVLHSGACKPEEQVL
ncbi:hypothetical protein VTN00DRAFT_10195 [Thermoascus crustaceus]|uniref:uncharacterized protein n=1 Tax=Thermoascus crustaceus TaxID=5088 RepID=UPI00374490F1